MNKEKIIIISSPSGAGKTTICKKKFINLKKNNFFIETAKVFDNYYGSPLVNINKAFNKKKHILFDIDWQGAKRLRKKFKKEDILDFFILPPSKIELKKRLISRGRDNNIEIKKRLSLAVKEISHYNEYKFILVNDNVDKTVSEILKIIKKEEELSKKLKLIK